MSGGPEGRVLVIGLDGATFRVIKPLVQVGRLPTLAKIMDEGVWGDLESTVPPMSPPAWSSFMTGKNPGKHGVYGFYAFRNGSYETSLVNTLAIKSRRFWEYFEPDCRVGLIDIPLTYPPQRVNGFMVSGLYVSSEQSIFTFPPDLHTELIRELGEYPLEQHIKVPKSGNQIEALQRLYRYTDSRKDAALYLMRKAPWDFFTVVFRGPDLIQHRAFYLWDEDYRRQHPEETQKWGEVINQYYEQLDRAIQQLMEAAGQNATVMIMSDHGAGPSRKYFYINRWLIEQGFLVLKPVSAWRAYRFGSRTPTLEGLLTKTHLSPLGRLVPRQLLARKLPLVVPRQNHAHPSAAVDWKRTKAYSDLTWNDGVIRLNLKGREPEGVVEPGVEYETIRSAIVQRLLELRDPESGEEMIEGVCRREEIYAGPYVDEAPDLVVQTKDTSYLFSVDLQPGGLFDHSREWIPGSHRIAGIFLMHGPAVQRGQELFGMRIIDIAPTILYLMGLPVPDDMDGRVILQGIEESYQQIHPLAFRQVSTDSLATFEKEEIFSVEEREKIEDKLRSLGYIE